MMDSDDASSVIQGSESLEGTHNSRPSTPESQDEANNATSPKRSSHSVSQQQECSSSNSPVTSSYSSSSSDDTDDDKNCMSDQNKNQNGIKNDTIHKTSSDSRKSRSRQTMSASSGSSEYNLDEMDENDANIKYGEHNQKGSSELNICHEDLNDISDLEIDENDKCEVKETVENDKNEDWHIEGQRNKTTFDINESRIEHHELPTEVHILKHNDDKNITDLRHQLDKKKRQSIDPENIEKGKDGRDFKNNGNVPKDFDVLSKKNDEDELDFEAEEGECIDIYKDDGKLESDNINKSNEKLDVPTDGDELEEGEVTDEDDKRPEELEPKPVCRFYTRGQCTWGMNCRFLHPGVTDKGNYTMFDMVRPVPLPHGGNSSMFSGHLYNDYRSERSMLHRTHVNHHIPFIATPHDPRMGNAVAGTEQAVPVVESAWERGLHTAKEMVRKATKRKEQDIDFEDKKMNLSLSQDELEKDNYYIRDRASPDVSPQYTARHPAPMHYEADLYGSGGGKASRPQQVVFDDDNFGRTARYRELPPHRMPQYEDDSRVRPAREVIVQRAEHIGRSDEWNDPWMRSKSPQIRVAHESRDDDKKRERCSSSSNSSYSSSSTSRSDSSSISTISERHRYSSAQAIHKSPLMRRHMKSDSRRVKSSSDRSSPNMKKRFRISCSPITDKKPTSPSMKRKKIRTPLSRKISATADNSRRRKRGSSSSGSRTSFSDSDSSNSSTSDSSAYGNSSLKRKRTKQITFSNRNTKQTKKVDVSKKRSPILDMKKTANSPMMSEANASSSLATINTKKTTRREELLKQLRAVEDAIAKRRSRLT